MKDSVPLQTSYEVIESMEGFVQEQLHLLKPVENCWQSSDFLPALTASDWKEQMAVLRRRTEPLTDEILVILIGNMITEEALPSYQTWLSGLRTIGDKPGTSQNPWAQWARGWTAEENRHGDLLHAYLMLSGRVDMRSIDITTQHLIRNGFDPLTGNHPYEGLVYTSIQERATAIAHKNTGKLAGECGDETLEKMCLQIAADEIRHETAYKRFFEKVLELDPNTALKAFENMMRKKIIMPARLMTDCSGQDLFLLHVTVTQKSSVYTTQDYAEVIDHLVEYWDIPNLKSLNAEGEKSRDYLCGLSESYHKRAERMKSMVERSPKQPCPWIFNREV